jgi:hypothetical protein
VLKNRFFHKKCIHKKGITSLKQNHSGLAYTEGDANKPKNDSRLYGTREQTRKKHKMPWSQDQKPGTRTKLKNQTPRNIPGSNAQAGEYWQTPSRTKTHPKAFMESSAPGNDSWLSSLKDGDTQPLTLLAAS